MCFLAIWKSSFEKAPFSSSVHFFTESLIFWSLVFELPIYSGYQFFDCYIASKDFLPFSGWPLQFRDHFFCVQKPLDFTYFSSSPLIIGIPQAPYQFTEFFSWVLWLEWTTFRMTTRSKPAYLATKLMSKASEVRHFCPSNTLVLRNYWGCFCLPVIQLLILSC
jgi:hypothetical protein